MDPLISARRLDLVIVNKKPRTCRIVDLAITADHRVKLKENEKRDKYLGLARELKKTIKHKSDGDTNCNRCARYSHQRIGKRTGRIKRKEHPNDNTVKIG